MSKAKEQVADVSDDLSPIVELDEGVSLALVGENIGFTHEMSTSTISIHEDSMSKMMKMMCEMNKSMNNNMCEIKSHVNNNMCEMKDEMTRSSDEIKSHVNNNMYEMKNELSSMEKKILGHMDEQLEAFKNCFEEKYDKMFNSLEVKFIDLKAKIVEEVKEIDYKVDGVIEEIKEIKENVDKKLQNVQIHVTQVEGKLQKDLEQVKVDGTDMVTNKCNDLRISIEANTRKIDDLENNVISTNVGATIHVNDNGVSDQLFREGIIFTGDNEGLHPMEFLNLLESRFKNYTVHGHRRLAFTLQCMKGQSKTWLLGNEFTSFDDFKEKFIEHFWGENAQAGLMKHIYSAYYTGGKQGAPSTYFKRMLRHGTYLTNTIPEEMLVRQILNHFTTDIKIHLINLENDAKKITKLLERLESEHMIFEPNHMYNGNYQGTTQRVINNGPFQYKGQNNIPHNFNTSRSGN